MPESQSTRQVPARRLDRLLRPFLTPFVVVGWGIAEIADFGGSLSAAATYGQWVKGVLPACAAFIVVLFVPFVFPIMFAYWLGLEDSTITTALLPLTIPVAILGVAGIMRGTYFAMDGVTAKQLMPRHRSDPISVGRILVTLLISVGGALLFGLLAKLNSPR